MIVGVESNFVLELTFRQEEAEHCTRLLNLRSLTESGQEQAESLARTIDKVVGIATVIPLDAHIIKHSLAVQLTYELPSQDSVVFASMDSCFDAQDGGPKVFANKNRRDFATGLIEDQLARYNCKLLPLFSQARAYIEGRLTK